jgi:aryl-alcohol dehydrogenase-like predicted oxidoreductase
MCERLWKKVVDSLSRESYVIAAKFTFGPWKPKGDIAWVEEWSKRDFVC